MLIKKLKETLPLLVSCLIVLGVGVVGFSLTETDAALITDNITPPPAEEEVEGAFDKKPVIDTDSIMADVTQEDVVATTGLFTYTESVFLADSNVNLEGEFLNDIYVAGNNVTLRGQVQGDVFAAGSNVTIAANVAGDVFAGGSNVNITGVINGDVRVAGSEIMIDNYVSGNVLAFGENIDITEQAYVGRNLTIAADTVMMSGDVTNNILGQAHQLLVYGRVGNNIILDDVDELIIHDSASIGGNVEYTATQTSAIPEYAIKGEILFHPAMVDDTTEDERNIFKTSWFVIKLIVGLVGYLLLGLVYIRLKPKFVQAVSTMMRSQPLGSIGRGLLYFFLAPLVILILALTLIGLPLSLVLLLMTILLLFVAKIHVGVALGQLLLPRVKSMYGPFCVGFSLFYVFIKLLAQGGLVLTGISTLLCTLALCWSTGAIIKQWKQNHD